MKKVMVTALFMTSLVGISQAQTKDEKKSAVLEVATYNAADESTAPTAPKKEDRAKEKMQPESAQISEMEQEVVATEAKPIPVKGLTENQQQRIAELDKAIVEKKKAINENTELSKEQKEKALLQMQSRIDAQMKSILGDAGYETYKKSKKN